MDDERPGPEAPPPGEEARYDGGDARYDEVFDRVFDRVLCREAVIARERAQGREVFSELMRHPPARQLLLVANSARYRSPTLCERLLEESQAEAFRDVAKAQILARLAVAVAGHLTEVDCGGEEPWRSLQARAWAQLGNACRLHADHPAAEQAFERARAVCLAGVELLAKARVLDLEASLRRDQRRFDEASQLLDEVIAIYHQLGQRNLLGRSLKQKSMVCGEAGDIESEIALLRCALKLLDPAEEPRTFLAARHNLIVALNETGRSREAFALLFHTRPLYLKLGDRMNLLRLRWLEGAVAFGLGRIEQAELAFREVRDAYVELELDCDAAVVSLDLAGVYAREGRSAELLQLAEEMLAIFHSHRIPREAMAALVFFCEAARQEKVESRLVQLVEDTASFLKLSRDNPDLQFQRPTEP